MKLPFHKKRRKQRALDMDDVFADALNLSDLQKESLEGKKVRLISSFNIYFLSFLFFFILIIFSVRLFDLQLLKGEKYRKISLNNSLEKNIIFAKRGIIKDRYGRVLAFNSDKLEDIDVKGELTENVYKRKYSDKYQGLAHILGYVKYPARDKNGNFWREDYEGVSGVEEYFNDFLNGKKGAQLIEKDASGKIISSTHIIAPQDGKNLNLSIDAKLNDELYKSLASYIETESFQSGAAAIMDIKSGEILAMVSYPEFDLNKMTEMDEGYLKSVLSDKRKPLLNRVSFGTYAPGSIVKPFMALAALEENIISPEKKLLSTGALKLPNPYNPDKPTIFRDWKVHGWVDMKEAIAHSSDEYFYIIGGGYKDQEGLGIKRILKYMHLFGLGEKSGVELNSESAGLVPSPKWKEEVFAEPWNIGDTYHTSIGQFGFLLTPLQALRATAAIASYGKLHTPSLVKNAKRPLLELSFSKKDFNVIHDAMRMATNIGTARPLKISGIEIAAKTGTAQTGVNNERKNSWIIGFWPYKNPRFAFVAMLDRGDEHETGSASHAMMHFFRKIIKEIPEYARGEYPSYEKESKSKDEKELKKEE